MDNNKQAENLLANMLLKATELSGILEQVKTGDGLGLNPEQKTEFLKQVQNNKEIEKAEADLATKMQELRDALYKTGK